MMMMHDDVVVVMPMRINAEAEEDACVRVRTATGKLPVRTTSFSTMRRSGDNGEGIIADRP